MQAPKEKGQSLIEVVGALAIALIVILALVRVTVTSMRNANFAKNQALATQYAQEGMEKIRAYRDQNDWSTFVANCNTTLTSLVPPTPFSLSPASGCTCGADSCTITEVITWTDAQGTHKSELTTRLTNWQ